VVARHYYAMEGQGWAKRDKQTDSHRRTIGWFDATLFRKTKAARESPHALRNTEEHKKEFLVQLGEFDTGGLQDRNAGVRVFPK